MDSEKTLNKKSSKLEKPLMTFGEMLNRIFNTKSTSASVVVPGKLQPIHASKILQNMNDKKNKKKKLKIIVASSPNF